MSNLLRGVIKILVNVVIVFATAFGAAWGAGSDFDLSLSLAVAAVLGNLTALFQGKPGAPPAA